mmetsp:Transcript_109917/g.354917  ORF Transcript_109917/g.354917 Transcript_109917/m.354917 type:complete len:218 (-) Transcript_109917:815-1468(-)
MARERDVGPGSSPSAPSEGSSLATLRSSSSFSRRTLMASEGLPMTVWVAWYFELKATQTASGSKWIMGRTCMPERLQSSVVQSCTPKVSTSSAVCTSLAEDSSPGFPWTPITPQTRGWLSSQQPLASSRVSTGERRRSASRRISAAHPTQRPPMAMMTRPLPSRVASCRSRATAWTTGVSTIVSRILESASAAMRGMSGTGHSAACTSTGTARCTQA